MNPIQTVVEVLLIASASFFLVAAAMDGHRSWRPVGAPMLTPRRIARTVLR
jgi:hypothetical protein